VIDLSQSVLRCSGLRLLYRARSGLERDGRLHLVCAATR